MGSFLIGYMEVTHSLLYYVLLFPIINIFFKPGTQTKAAHAWFLEIALVRVSVCVCVCLSVCVSAPKGINN